MMLLSPFSGRSGLFLAILAIAAVAATSAQAERASVARSKASVCAEGIARQERSLGIPRNLLAAISLAESGRWDNLSQEIVAWPWTVMAEGEGRFLANKAEAVAEVRALQERGVTNIDVGCMQINLQYHPDAFSSLDEAFDPAANTAYAGRFLASLRDEAGSWTVAATHYHSRTPERARSYGEKLNRLWAGLGGSAGARIERAPLALPAQAVPGEESVFDTIFANPPAMRPAAPAAPRRGAIVPIDYERTAALNGRLRARQAGAAEGRGAPAALRGRVASDSARSRDLDAFAAKRQQQLARWRRDGRL